MSFFVFKHKTAYERRSSDWSSDVCSSDLDRDSFIGQARLFQVESDFRGVRRRMKIEADHVTLRSGPVASDLFARRAVRRSSEERRVGHECVSTCRSRWSTTHSQKQLDSHHISTKFLRIIHFPFGTI